MIGCRGFPSISHLPSETQLRSRLKKWRVTKPSRQTRKKVQGSDDGDSEKDGQESSTSPSNRPSPPMTKEISSVRPTWSTPPAYALSDSQSSDHPSSKWSTPLAQQLSPSPSGENGLVGERSAVYAFSDTGSTTTSFEQPPAQTTTVTEGLMLNTTDAIAPSFAGYPLSPDSCFPSPNSANAAMAWPPRSVSLDMSLNQTLHPTHWYPMSFETITPPPGHAHPAPLAPATGFRDQVPMMAPLGPGVYPPDFPHYSGEGPEWHGYDAKNWRRAMSLQYDYAGSHGPVRPDLAERKHFSPHGHPPPGMMPMPATQPGGPQTMRCAPLVTYLGQDPIVHKQHPGVGY